MSEPPFHLLALDGGGLRGIFSAAFLGHIEEHTGKRCADHFDLIVGTSTGAIIALGLASGMPAADVLQFYQEQGQRIFSKPRRFRQVFIPKYDDRCLIEALKDVFGDRTLNDLKVPVCIPSYELVEGMPRVFKDDHNEGLHWGGGLPIWKVAAASSAAPLFFPAAQVETQDSYVDGGIWANNPVIVGITEAIRYFNRDIGDIRALSVGTGTHAFRLERKRSAALGWAGWGWNKRIVNMVFDAQSASANYMAKLLLWRPDQYLRVDADLSSQVPLDSYDDALPLI